MSTLGRSRASSALVGLLFVFLAAPLVADADGYAAVFDCRAESAELVAEHHHDWSRATEPERFRMISTDKNVLDERNTYAWVRVSRRSDGREIFRVPAPALSYLWISPDSRFVVGVSSIKLWNPLQAVVWDAEGKVRLAKAVTNASFPGVFESVTNRVEWYDGKSPEIAIEKKGDRFVLRVAGNAGEARTFEFPAKP